MTQSQLSLLLSSLKESILVYSYSFVDNSSQNDLRVKDSSVTAHIVVDSLSLNKGSERYLAYHTWASLEETGLTELSLLSDKIWERIKLNEPDVVFTGYCEKIFSDLMFDIEKGEIDLNDEQFLLSVKRRAIILFEDDCGFGHGIVSPKERLHIETRSKGMYASHIKELIVLSNNISDVKVEGNNKVIIDELIDLLLTPYIYSSNSMYKDVVMKSKILLGKARLSKSAKTKYPENDEFSLYLLFSSLLNMSNVYKTEEIESVQNFLFYYMRTGEEVIECDLALSKLYGLVMDEKLLFLPEIVEKQTDYVINRHVKKSCPNFETLSKKGSGFGLVSTTTLYVPTDNLVSEFIEGELVFSCFKTYFYGRRYVQQQLILKGKCRKPSSFLDGKAEPISFPVPHLHFVCGIDSHGTIRVFNCDQMEKILIVETLKEFVPEDVLQYTLFKELRGKRRL